jgi:hypothetical protein
MSRTGQCASTTALSFANSSWGRGALERHSSLHSRKPRAHPFVDSEKSAQVERPIELDRDAFQRHAKRCRVSAVGDLLTRCQSRVDQLHRVRARVRAAEGGRLVDRQRELANPGLAAEVFDLSRIH